MRNFTLLSHQWKAATRSAAVSKSVGINIFMGFVFVIIFFELIGGGFYLGSTLAEKSQNPIANLMQYGFYFFLAILMSRYMLQKLPSFMVTPYLNLPIRKNKLVNFILTKPLFSGLNVLPLSFVLTTTIGLHKHLDAYTFWMIIAIVIIGDLVVNYLSIYIKRVQIKHEFVFYLFLASVAGFILLDHFEIVNFQAISSEVFMQVIQNPLWLLAGIFTIGYGLLPQFPAAIQALLLR